MPDHPTRFTEATREAFAGGRSFSEVSDLVEDAIECRYQLPGAPSPWIWIRDLGEDWVVFEVEGCSDDGCYKVGYTIADDGTVTLSGDPVAVEARTVYDTTEATDRVDGRVVEARGAAADGGRIFRVRIIQPGTSRNGMRYPESVLRAAAPLYEGAKAFDHHRTTDELQSSAITGLIGHYRNVEATGAGVFADLHLLPSATHTAEALDASVSAQDQGLPPLVGVSHDVQLVAKPAIEDGRRIQEAVAINNVLSADVVADPSAGGRATRVVAGGTGSNLPTPSREDNAMTLKELLDKLREASDEERAALIQEHQAVLDEQGLTSGDIDRIVAEPPAPTSEGTDDREPELVGAGATESTHHRGGPLAGVLVRSAVEAAGLPEGCVELVTSELPERFTEAQLTTTVRTIQRTIEGAERAGLRPSVPHVAVGEENLDKKRKRLDATFDKNWQEGYTSLSEAYFDITGQPFERLDGDVAARIIRESWDGPMVGRTSESVASSTWGSILADSMNRRMVAMYTQPNLQSWRQLASTAPVGDFRSQKLVRMGGYGVLPTVNEGAPYQPLTSPSDEKATYTPTKKGGTEDYTFEAAKNDDIRALVQIPDKLGLAASQTLYRGVFDIFANNSTVYDSVALFHASHANTATNALSYSNMNAGRKAMRKQAAYGDSYDVLSLVPKTLVVVTDLEELGNEICNGQRGVPATTPGASDVPNLHQGTQLLVVDYFSSTTAWYLVADPTQIPTIEVGFMDGKVNPELFVQDDPKVGSVFSSDKVTWKIRHIWGLAVVDYRGFYRGNT